MNKTVMSFLLCVGIFSGAALAKGHHRGTEAAASQAAATTLTADQEEALRFMYQEEKLARDLYAALGEEWGSRIFSNIQRSEQRHMDAVRGLLEKYSVPVPVIEDTPGVFENEELQALYEQLLEQGSLSEKEALEVGVLVEETDMEDLNERMKGATDDMVAVFEKLLKGSENHLRAFNRNLDRSGNTSSSSKTSKTKKGKKSRKKKRRSNRRSKRGN